VLGSKRVIVLRLTLVACGLATLAIVPTAWLDRLPDLCLFERWFDHACLGCGMTRALSTALHGDPAAAQALNPLAGYALCFAVGWFGADVGLLIDRQRGTS